MAKEEKKLDINDTPLLDRLEKVGKDFARCYSIASRYGLEDEAEKFRQISLQLAEIHMQADVMFVLIETRFNELYQALTESECEK